MSQALLGRNHPRINRSQEEVTGYNLQDNYFVLNSCVPCQALEWIDKILPQVSLGQQQECSLSLENFRPRSGVCTLGQAYASPDCCDAKSDPFLNCIKGLQRFGHSMKFHSVKYLLIDSVIRAKSDNIQHISKESDHFFPW